MTAIIEWSVHPAIGSLITLPAEWWRENAERRAAALAEEAHLLALDCVGLQSFARLCEVEEARIMLDAEMEWRVPHMMLVDHALPKGRFVTFNVRATADTHVVSMRWEAVANP